MSLHLWFTCSSSVAMTAKYYIRKRKNFMGVELSGKTLGVVGCGRIGQVVHSCNGSFMDMPDVTNRIAEVMDSVFYLVSAIHLNQL
jgi:D-isomer specific 2-hydroxyacid dehydrogenase, NAD binding domain